MNTDGIIPTIIVPIFSGLFGGVAWSAWWELYAHPKRERRNLSLALSSELATNLFHVRVASATSKESERPPDGFGLQTAVFDAIAGRFGELDPNLLGRVAITYQLIGNINRLAESYQALGSQPEAPNTRHFAISRLGIRQGAIARAFWEQMRTLEEQLDEVVPALVSSGKRIRLRVGKFRASQR